MANDEGTLVFQMIEGTLMLVLLLFLLEDSSELTVRSGEKVAEQISS